MFVGGLSFSPMDLPIGILECPHSVAAGKWTRVSDPRECVFLILSSYLTFSLFSKVHIFSSFIKVPNRSYLKVLLPMVSDFILFFSKEWCSSASSGKVPFLFLSCRLISFFLNQLPQILFLPSFLPSFSFFLLLTPLFFFSLPHAPPRPSPSLSRKAGLYLC